ncbi:GlsB/YeaQ/YmgE family stress response membrane protein [Cryptosporangium japonicum]
MTITGIVSAVGIGLLVGALGRLVVPGRQRIPLWLTLVIGIAAALLGTIVVRLAGVSTAGFSGVELVAQVALAALGVGLVAAGSGRSARTR